MFKKNKMQYILLSTILVFSMLMQIAHPILVWALEDIEGQIKSEWSAEDFITDKLQGEESSKLVFQILDEKGEAFPDVELELVKRGTNGYERAFDSLQKSNSDGFANFPDISLEPEASYGVIASGLLQSLASDYSKDPVIWFTALPDDLSTKIAGAEIISISLENQNMHRFILNPLNENNLMVYGDIKFISINGETDDGSTFTKLINFYNPTVPLVLPEGKYTINMNANTIIDADWPNYFFTKTINIPSDIPTEALEPEELDYPIINIGGETSAELILKPSAAVEDPEGIVSAISIFPEGQLKTSIIYTQITGGIRKIYLTPGTYDTITTISTHISTDTITYFLERQITVSEKEAFVLNLDDRFTSTLKTDKTSYEKGDVVNLDYSIKDSSGSNGTNSTNSINENVLIAKAKNLPISITREEADWSTQVPTLRILNSNNEEIYVEKIEPDPGLDKNEFILDKWNGWNPFSVDQYEYSSSKVDLVQKLEMTEPFFSRTYKIPEDIASGVYTAEIDLGEGTHSHTQNTARFIIIGQESNAPILESLVSPTNAKAIMIKGNAMPKDEISIYYSLNGEIAKTLIGTKQAAEETGFFEIEFEPTQEGIYSFVASCDGNYSQQIYITIDRTPPNKPEKLEGISYDDKTIYLTWETPRGEAVLKYEIYRNGALISTVAATDKLPEYRDKGLESKVEYKYEVKSVDLARNKSKAAEIIMFTKEKPNLKITSVNWIGAWDNQNHLNMGSDIDITIVGTAGKSAKAILEYVDNESVVSVEEISLEETVNNNEATETDTGIYKGTIIIPEGVKTITKLTGHINEGEYNVEMDAISLPASVNGSLKVKLSAATIDKLEEIKGAELSLYSKIKNSGMKVIIDSSSEYTLSGLIPSDDYELKLVSGQKILGEYKNVKVTGGFLKTEEFNFSQAPASLAICVTDDNGMPISKAHTKVLLGDSMIGGGYSNLNGWVIDYSTQSSLDSQSEVVKNRLEGETLNLTISMAGLYFQRYNSPIKREITLSPGRNEITIIATERPKAKITGRVKTVDGTELSNATIVAYTKINGEIELSAFTTSNEDGEYNLEVFAGDVRLLVMHNLSQTKEYMLEESLKSGEDRVYDISFPIEKKILVDIKTKNIGDPNYYHNYMLDRKIKISIKNNGQVEKPKSELITEFKGDDIYFSVPNAEPGDIIEVTADGTNYGYSKQTVISNPLDENSWTRVNIELEEQGKVKAEFQDYYDDAIDYSIWATVYKVNQGKLSYVKSVSTNSDEIIIPTLTQGKYTIVFHNINFYYGISYEEIMEFLGECGAVVEEIELTDGKITSIGTVKIKKYSEPTWSYFRGYEGNEFRTSVLEVSPSKIATLTAKYSYESSAVGLRNLNFFVSIPKGSMYVEDSLVIKHSDNRVMPAEWKPKAYYLRNSKGEIETINLHIGGSAQLGLEIMKVEGTITYQVRFSDNPEGLSAISRFWAKFDGRNRDEIETIGEVMTKMPYVSIYAPSNIYDREIHVSGQAPAGATIKIYDSSYYLGETKANNHGLWNASVVLPNRGDPATYFLVAETTNEVLSYTVSSDVATVNYDTFRPKITKVMFGQTDSFMKEIKLNSTFRYLVDQTKEHKIEIYFDDSSRIENFQILSANGDVVAGKDQIIHEQGQNKFSTSWISPIITDEIRIYYDIKKAPSKLADYVPIDEDVMRSGLPSLWGNATIRKVPEGKMIDVNPNDEGDEIFEIASEILLGDKNTIIETTMEISNFEGELPEGYSIDADMPVGIIDFKLNEDDTFEFSFIVPLDILLKEEMNIRQQSRIAVSAVGPVISLLAKRTPSQLVKVFGKKTVIEAGLDTYSLADTILGRSATMKHLKLLEALHNQTQSPCYNNTYMGVDYANAVRKEVFDTQARAIGKAALNIAFLGLGLIPGIGWGAALAIAVGTTIVGYAVDKAIENYEEKNYNELKAWVDGNMKPNCPRSPEKGDPDGNNSESIGRPRPVGLVDPSGFVYEGVESNRIEGVITTAFEKVDGEWQFWDAEWFGQENPLITNNVGFYQWDVPEGSWKVMYQKEGYHVAFSDELPVPPPQLEVNIGIVSLAAPMLTEVKAESGGIISLIFDKYMQVSTINSNTFKVYEKILDDTGNKVAIVGKITGMDAEVDPKNPDNMLARTFKFIPEAPLKTGDEFNVWVSDMVENYANRTLESEFSQEIKIPEKMEPPVDPPEDPKEPEEPSEPSEPEEPEEPTMNLPKLPAKPSEPEKPKEPIEPIADPEEAEVPPVDHPNEPPVVGKLVVQTIKYEAKEAIDINSLVVYKKDAKGNMTVIKASIYDIVTKTMRFYAEEDAEYIIGYNPIIFDDTEMWAKEYIQYLAARGIAQGIGYGKFQPRRNITRAEFLKLLVSTLDNIDLDIEKYKKSSFKDVSTDAWYAKYIEWAAGNKVVCGYGNGNFGPEDLITRQEMAKMLNNFLKAIQLELEAKHTEIKFKDVEEIAEWAKEDILEIQKAGIINGKPGEIYDPKGNAERAEAAKVIAELLKRYIR